MIARSPWRTLLYDRLAKITLKGEVIDLGGSRKSAYTSGFKGDFKLTVANFEGDAPGDIALDLEQPFAISSQQYDHVLCINVLEHIFNYQNVINEAHRILKPGGQATFAVPFLIQVHPSPHDHWRFTGETLQRLFTEAGFTSVTVEPIGTGVFGAVAQLKYGILHFPILRNMERFVAETLDRLLSPLNKKNLYSQEYYPLGYVIQVKNPTL